MIIVVYYPDSTSHLAIGLTGLGPDKNIYISFFPANEKSIAGFRLHHFKHDQMKDNHSHRAATVVILPTEESCGYGLSEKAIYDWWKNDFVPNQETFNWFTNNCSSVVYRALCVGQLHSTTLRETLLKEKYWFCTPGKVLSYSIDLANFMYRGKSPDKELLLKFAEMQAICEFGKLKNPYSQFLALYVRIKQATTPEYNLILKKPFCDMIKNVLIEFANKIPSGSSPSERTQLLTLADMTDAAFKEINIDLFFDKLKNLVEYILLFDESKQLQKCGVTSGPLFDKCQLLQRAYQVLEAALASQLLTPMASYIDQYANTQSNPFLLQESATIHQTLNQFSDNLVEANNPHKEYVQQSDPLPLEFRHISFNRAMF